MQSGKQFNESSKNCDFYVVSVDKEFNPVDKLFCNIRYIFDFTTFKKSSGNNFIHLVEIPNDAIVELGIYCYKSNKLNIKKTWELEDFININKLRIIRMMSNRHLFDQFDDINHMLSYNV